MTFGERLKQLRNEKKLTQEELAQQLGYQRSTLANWEIDRADPDSEALKKVALFFNSTVDYLLFGQTHVSESPGMPEIGPGITLPADLTDDEKKQIQQFAYFVKSLRKQAEDEQAAVSGQ